MTTANHTALVGLFKKQAFLSKLRAVINEAEPLVDTAREELIPIVQINKILKSEYANHFKDDINIENKDFIPPELIAIRDKFFRKDKPMYR